MIVYLDFESYYDADYSLQRMSTEEYVRDSKFNPYLLGFAIDDSPVYLARGADAIASVLRALPLQTSYVVAHNAVFDAMIIEAFFGMSVPHPLCTMALMRWCGISRLVRESQASLCEFLGTGVKGEFIQNMRGRTLDSLSPEELDQYEKYCVSDVEALRTNAKHMFQLVPQWVLSFISLSLRMYTQPRFLIDVPLLEAYYNELKQRYEAARERIQHLFSYPDSASFLKAIRSKDKFCQMLESVGGVVPMKVSAAKTKTLRSTDPGAEEVLIPALAKSDLAFQALLDDPNEDIRTLVEVRMESNSSIAMSRTNKFLWLAQRGPMCIELQPLSAWTGRYTAGATEGGVSSKSNVQNLAKRKGDKTLRKALLSQPGQMIVAADSSQIEARVLAWIANEEWLLDAFRNGDDPYSMLAEDIFHVPWKDIKAGAKGGNKEYWVYRNIGKTCILSAGYRVGVKKFSDTLLREGFKLGDTEEDHAIIASRSHSTYREKNSRIVELWYTCDRVLQHLAQGGSGVFGGPQGVSFQYGMMDVFGKSTPSVSTPSGFILRYPNLRFEYNEERRKNQLIYDRLYKGKLSKSHIHGGTLTENISQSFAFLILAWQAVNMRSRGVEAVLNVHDEWVCMVPEDQTEVVQGLMIEEMRRVPEWAAGLPLDCEASHGKNYGEV